MNVHKTVTETGYSYGCAPIPAGDCAGCGFEVDKREAVEFENPKGVIAVWHPSCLNDKYPNWRQW